MKHNATKTNTDQGRQVSLWQLFVTFFKTGLFTFGGGYAMISILEEELVAKKHWITSRDMLDMLVIAESTPGVIAVNTATSVGFRMRGILGAIVATLGVVLPSFVIISALSYVINAFADNTWYKAAFTGVQACVTVLVVNAFIKMFRQLESGWFSALMLTAAFNVALFTDFNVIFLILIGGASGILYSLVADSVSRRKGRKLPLENSDIIDGERSDDGENRQSGGDE